MIEVGKKSARVDTEWDSVIIALYIDGKNGGKAVDASALEDEYLTAGHVIVKQDDTLKPAKIEGNAYAALSGAVPVGVVYKTHNPREEGTAIMTRGKVNEKAYENRTGVKYTDEIKKALNLIEFTED